MSVREYSATASRLPSAPATFRERRGSCSPWTFSRSEARPDATLWSCGGEQRLKEGGKKIKLQDGCRDAAAAAAAHLTSEVADALTRLDDGHLHLLRGLLGLDRLLLRPDQEREREGGGRLGLGLDSFI